MSSAESVVWSDEMAVAKQVWVLQLDSGDFVKVMLRYGEKIAVCHALCQ